MLASAVEHYRRQQRIAAQGLTDARRARRKGSLAVAQRVALYQLAAAQESIASGAAMLAEQGIKFDPLGTPVATSVAGVASDGRPLATLFPQARNDYAFDLMVTTQIHDAGRAAASLLMVTQRHVQGYIRMLTPPSCSRCAVLAGRWYKWNSGFERHPNCDCVHVPARESGSRELRTNPDDYFNSLSAAEQDRIFTQAGAQAIRDGADISQVVNVRRGMEYAGQTLTGLNASGRVVNITHRTAIAREIGSGSAYISREGITRYGLANRANTGRNMVARLTPESIYQIADDRADALRMLQLHGYIF